MGQPLVIEKWAENLEEVTLSRWLKAVGDELAEGDSLCEIITDKVTFEYEIESRATLLATYCREKSVLPVGYVMAYVGEVGEEPPGDIEARNAELLREHAAKTALHLDLGQGETGAAKASPRAPDSRVRATPAARRVAREARVAMEDVAQWAKPDGPVTEADVQAYLEAHRGA